MSKYVFLYIYISRRKRAAFPSFQKSLKLVLPLVTSDFFFFKNVDVKKCLIPKSFWKRKKMKKFSIFFT